jgi:hypothetical protein
MKRCSKYQNQFIEALYDELDNKTLSEFKIHLKKCSECQKEFEHMKNTIKQFKNSDISDPGEQYWNNYWSKLNQRMEEENIQVESEPGSSNIFSMDSNIRTWTVRILSAAAMLLIGIGIGYLYFGNSDSISPISQQIPAQTVTYPQEAADYLESSKVLLLGFVNFDTDEIDPTTMDFSRQQQAARSLIQKAAVLKDDLEGKENQRILALIQELEIILLQISNYEKEFDIPAIELIKSGVDNNAILMKINLEEIMRAVSEENNQSNKSMKKIQES